jgi:hypothetical protein
MHFLFNLLRIKGLYKFRALLAHPQEALQQRHLVYCVRVMSSRASRLFHYSDRSEILLRYNVGFIKTSIRAKEIKNGIDNKKGAISSGEFVDIENKIITCHMNLARKMKKKKDEVPN